MKPFPLCYSLLVSALILGSHAAQAQNSFPPPVLKMKEISKDLNASGSKDSAKAKSMDSLLSVSDFEKSKLSFKFVNGTDLQMTGIDQPSHCVEGLSMTDVIDRTSSDENSVSAEEQDADLSPAHHEEFSRVGIKVAYSGDYKSYSECANAHKGDEDKLDLTELSALSKTALNSDKEAAQVGLLDAQNKISLLKDVRSSAYLKQQNLVKRAQCVECNRDSRRAKALLGELAKQPSALATPLMKGMIGQKMEELAESIEKARNLNQLKSLEDELSYYAALIATLEVSDQEKEELAAHLAANWSNIANHSVMMAKQDPAHAKKYVSFLSELYGKEAALPGMDSQARKDALAEQKAFAPNGSKRLSFLSDLDPGNDEVRDYLDHGVDTLRSLYARAQSACSINSRQFSQCGTASQNYQLALSNMETFSKRFVLAQQANATLAQNALRGMTTPLSAQMNGQANVGSNSSASLQAYNPNDPSFQLSPSVFPNAQSYNAPVSPSSLNSANNSAANLYNQGSTIYQSKNSTLYKISAPVIAVPLQSNFPSNSDTITTSPITTSYTPSFQYNS